MEKDLQEDLLKDLEEEIDSAVDRLFVETQKRSEGHLLKPNSDLAPLLDEERDREPSFDVGSLSAPVSGKEAQKSQAPSFGTPDQFPDQLEDSYGLLPPSMPAPPEPTLQAKSEPFEPLPWIEETRDLKPSAMAVKPKPIAQTKPAPYDMTDDLERMFDFQPSAAPSREKPAVQSPPYLKSIDQLEAQILSLEWEITREKLEKAWQEVAGLRELLKEKKDISSVLGYMGSVLAEMIAEEQNIHPSMIKFLLDAKDTVKLLFEQENEREFEIYKQLARDGIEARFASLRELKKPAGERTAEPPARHPAEPVSETVRVEWKRVEESLNQWNRFFEKAESLLQRIEQRLSELERRSLVVPAPPEKQGLPLMDITVFKVFGKLYGVESQKIAKLYRLPSSLGTDWGDHSKILLKDKEVIVVDLKKAFPSESWQPGVMSKLLTIQSEGTWKGVLVEEVLKRFSACPSERKENGKPLLGTVQWNYQARSVDVPILDVGRL